MRKLTTLLFLLLMTSPSLASDQFVGRLIFRPSNIEQQPITCDAIYFKRGETITLNIQPHFTLSKPDLSDTNIIFTLYANTNNDPTSAYFTNITGVAAGSVVQWILGINDTILPTGVYTIEGSANRNGTNVCTIFSTTLTVDNSLASGLPDFQGPWQGNSGQVYRAQMGWSDFSSGGNTCPPVNVAAYLTSNKVDAGQGIVISGSSMPGGIRISANGVGGAATNLTPWVSGIDAAGYPLTNASIVSASNGVFKTVTVNGAPLTGVAFSAISGNATDNTSLAGALAGKQVTGAYLTAGSNVSALVNDRGYATSGTVSQLIQPGSGLTSTTNAGVETLAVTNTGGGGGATAISLFATNTLIAGGISNLHLSGFAAVTGTNADGYVTAPSGGSGGGISANDALTFTNNVYFSHLNGSAGGSGDEMGVGALALINGTALGRGAYAANAVAIGNNATVGGSVGALAAGNGANAGNGNNYNTALGFRTLAGSPGSGYDTAVGYCTTATGGASTANGCGAIAPSFLGSSFGMYTGTSTKPGWGINLFGAYSQAGATNCVILGTFESNNVPNSTTTLGTLFLDGGTNIMLRTTWGSGAYYAAFQPMQVVTGVVLQTTSITGITVVTNEVFQFGTAAAYVIP